MSKWIELAIGAAVMVGPMVAMAVPGDTLNEPVKPASEVSQPAALSKVLLIGDSITWGYAPTVQAVLKGKAEVTLIPDNSQTTAFGLENLQKWLGSNRWDVIHFNWGLWDLCYRNPQSPNQGHRDKVNGTLSITLEQYDKNLRELVKQLQATHAKLIWASTTPVPDGELGRIKGDDVKYNAVATKIMKENGIPTDDLYSYALPKLAEIQLPNSDVHYTDAGYDYLGRQVAGSIRQALGKNGKHRLQRNVPSRG